MKQNMSLYDKFYHLGAKDYKGIVKFYDDNAADLEDRTVFIDKDDFNTYVLIMAQYVVGLENLGKHYRATVFADKVISLVTSNIDEYQLDLINFTPYRSVWACKGRSHFVLKEFKKAEEAFSVLISLDPENMNFRKWHYTAKSKRRKSVNKYLLLASVLLIAVALIFGNKIDPPTVKLYLLILGFLLMWVVAFNSIFFDFIRSLFRRR